MHSFRAKHRGFPLFLGFRGSGTPELSREACSNTSAKMYLRSLFQGGLLRSYPDTERQRSKAVEHGESKRQANKRRSRGTAVCIIFRDWPGVRWPYGPWTGERLSWT